MLTLHQLSTSRHRIGNWSIVAFLTIALIVIGFEEASIKVIIGRFHNILQYYFFRSDIFPYSLEPEQLNVITSTSRRLINLVYRMIYCGVCLLILHKYFNNYAITKIALMMYFSAAILYVLLIALAKFLPFHPFLIIAFRIDTLIVSPMPIILFIPAFYLVVSSQKQTL